MERESLLDSTFMRRKAPRIEVLGLLHGQLVAMDLPITVRNLSAGGFGVESDIAFPAGATHQFRFTSDNDMLVVITASARYCQDVTTADGDTRYRTGFEFLHAPGGETARAVEMLLEAATSMLMLQ